MCVCVCVGGCGLRAKTCPTIFVPVAGSRGHPLMQVPLSALLVFLPVPFLFPLSILSLLVLPCWIFDLVGVSPIVQSYFHLPSVECYAFQLPTIPLQVLWRLWAVSTPFVFHYHCRKNVAFHIFETSCLWLVGYVSMWMGMWRLVDVGHPPLGC